MATNPYQPKLDELSKASQINADVQDFDESQGVAGRVDNIIRADSPLMQRAATRAAQQANQRGLLNSSMAVGSAQNAVIDAATPIATADAQLSQQQRLANQAAKNSASQFNSTQRTNIGMSGLDMAEGARQFDANQGLQREQLQTTERTANAQMANQRVIAQMDADNRVALANLEAGFKTEIASNENIANAWGTLMQEIGKIQNNPDIEPDAKKTLIQNNMNSFQSFTSFWKKINNGAVDVSDLLNFGPADTTPSKTSPAPAERTPLPPRLGGTQGAGSDDFWTNPGGY